MFNLNQATVSAITGVSSGDDATSESVIGFELQQTRYLGDQSANSTQLNQTTLNVNKIKRYDDVLPYLLLQQGLDAAETQQLNTSAWKAQEATITSSYGYLNWLLHTSDTHNSKRILV